MLEGKDTINIVCACDDNYVIMLCAMIKSIEINHKFRENIDLYVIDHNIEEINKEKVEKSINSEKITIIWKRIDKETLKYLKVRDENLDLTTHYLRLLIPYLLPETLKKVIYLDCDLLLFDEIATLWNTPLDGFPIAAIQDGGVGKMKDGWQIPNHQELGLNPEAKYFNSGVLIIDLIAWKEGNFSEKIIRCTEENINHNVLWDQYGFNVIFQENWKELEHAWNFFQYNKYIPKIVHYAMKSAKPIYASYSGNYASEFFGFLDKTEWKGWRPYKNITKDLQIHEQGMVPSLLNKLGLKGVGATVGVTDGDFLESILKESELHQLYSLIDVDLEEGDTYLETVLRLWKFKERSVVVPSKSEGTAHVFQDECLDFFCFSLQQPSEVIENSFDLWWQKLRFGGLFVCGEAFSENLPSDNCDGEKIIAGFVGGKNLALHKTDELNDHGLPTWYGVKEQG
jgi:lipopolysaccharide biosynthesis glycosyltransferase